MEATKARLARGYSQSAPHYDALAGHMYLAGIRRLLPRLRVPPMAAILDVGCGTGVNLLEAARQFAPTRLLCGIDLSPGMVAVARSKAASLGVPALFTVGDAEQLPYEDGTFDVVLCNSVLHWFKNRGAALREMARVLRPGGQVAIICAAHPGFSEWFGLAEQLLDAVGLGKGASVIPALPTAAEVSGLMQSAGFGVQHLHNPIYPQVITDVDSFVQVMSTVAPHWIADLPADAQQIMQQLMANMMRIGWPGGFPNTWAAVEAVGVRLS